MRTLSTFVEVVLGSIFGNRLSLILVATSMPRIAQTKNGHPPKTCASCGLPFEWRKKWERDWDNVKFCSQKCKSAGVK